MGITKFSQSLGELEAEIMEIIWRLNSASVRQVLNELRKKRGVAYTTVMTVMSRLAKKGILRRKLTTTGAYYYTPVWDKSNFLALTSKKVINQLIKECGEVAVAQFLDILESRNLKDLKDWQKKLKKIK